MSAKGQANLVVAAAGFALFVGLTVFSTGIVEFSVLSVDSSLDSNYERYEAAVYSYQYVSKEDFRLTRSEAEKLVSRDCVHPEREDIRLFLSYDENSGKCFQVNSKVPVMNAIIGGEISGVNGMKVDDPSR